MDEKAESTEIPAAKKVYRCEHCNALVIGQDIQQGGCICGSRRVKVATAISEAELEEIKGRGYEFDANQWMDKETAEQERRMGREIQ